jgi:peptide/nickel transport system ATP-binding protein
MTVVLPAGPEAVTLRVRGLRVAYQAAHREDNTVVWDVDLDLRPGEILGLAGESGCGKSTAALAAIGFRPRGAKVLGGTSDFGGADLLALPIQRLRSIWGRHIAYVSQDASLALNPGLPIGRQLGEPLRAHLGLRGADLRRRQLELLESVGIPQLPGAMDRYPFQFSGGQQQRIAIAIALSCRPSVLILDEPTTGLDVTTQARISALLLEQIAGSGTAALFVSHDLSLLGAIARRLAVMYAGEIIEEGPARTIVTKPRHPYTQALLEAVPSIHQPHRVIGIPGRPPLSVRLDRCAFAPRCPHAITACHARIPLVTTGPDQKARCIRASELAFSVADLKPAEPTATATAETLLAVEDLVCTYLRAAAPAVRHVSFQVEVGEAVGVVGESGSGKTTLLRSIAGLNPPVSGRIRFRGANLADWAGRRSKAARQAIQLIFQNPDSSLNPRHTVLELVKRSMTLFRSDIPPSGRDMAVADLMAAVMLPRGIMYSYPSQLSGGQKQRVAIARAFAARPSLLLCDEVTSSLDVSVQATVLELISDLASRFGTSVLFVSHDLAVVRTVASRVIVLKDGVIVEEGDSDQVFRAPRHEYTQTLLRSIPDPLRDTG